MNHQSSHQKSHKSSRQKNRQTNRQPSRQSNQQKTTEGDKVSQNYNWDMFFDEYTGKYFDPKVGLYYDPDTKLYNHLYDDDNYDLSVSVIYRTWVDGLWYRPETNTFLTDDEADKLDLEYNYVEYASMF